MRKILVEHHNKGRSKYHINFKYIIAYYLLLGCRLKVHEPGKAVATVPDRNKLLDLLVNSALESDLAKSVYTLGPKDLIRRYLPPGNWSDIYHLYISFQNAKNLQCASPTTFFRVVRRGGWKKVLRFRNVSQHTACPTCQKLKAELRHARDVAAHARSADRLMRHLQGQFQDRQIYWGLRTKAKRDQNILVCIQDSMDKGKYALPKFIDGRVPKHLAMLTRPVLEVTANIIHGRLIYVALADEGENAGSSWSLEVLNRALDKAYLQAQTKGLTWPAELRIWSDNTPKESLTISSNMVLKSKCKITLLRVIPTMTFIHFVTDISSGILPGISSVHSIWHSIWHIFWHIIWQIFWPSIWQTFWHFIWHIFWHSIWHFIWHSIWHTFWHSIWHIFWHSIWHIFWHSIWHIILLCNFIWHIFWHSIWHSIWHIFWHSIWPLRSSGAHWAGKVPGWGPAVRTELGRSQVEVQRCATGV